MEWYFKAQIGCDMVSCLDLFIGFPVRIIKQGTERLSSCLSYCITLVSVNLALSGIRVEINTARQGLFLLSCALTHTHKKLLLLVRDRYETCTNTIEVTPASVKLPNSVCSQIDEPEHSRLQSARIAMNMREKELCGSNQDVIHGTLLDHKGFFPQKVHMEETTSAQMVSWEWKTQIHQRTILQHDMRPFSLPALSYRTEHSLAHWELRSLLTTLIITITIILLQSFIAI